MDEPHLVIAHFKQIHPPLIRIVLVFLCYGLVFTLIFQRTRYKFDIYGNIGFFALNLSISTGLIPPTLYPLYFVGALVVNFFFFVVIWGLRKKNT